MNEFSHRNKKNYNDAMIYTISHSIYLPTHALNENSIENTAGTNNSTNNKTSTQNNFWDL